MERFLMMRSCQLLAAAMFSIILAVACDPSYRDAEIAGRPANVFPDYDGVVLPVNIAAPGFRVDEELKAVRLEVGVSGRDAALVCRGRASKVIVPLRRWHRLLDKAAGADIFLRLYGKTQRGWVRFEDAACHVSPDRIDPYMVYRLIYPGYVLWGEMGIYQRELSSYKEKALIRNTDIGSKTCVNCHNFAGNDPEKMMFHIRGPEGGTVILRDGKVVKTNPAASPVSGELAHGATYPASEASGRFIAFSSNEIQQFFHADGNKAIEVSDLESDLFVYDTESGKALTSDSLVGKEWMETFPTWSGDSLIYFCRAKAYEQGMKLYDIRYDLCRVKFDPVTGSFGSPETVYAASSEGFSCSFPRVSPDGRWLMFTRSEYGNFSIWHHESELFLMDTRDCTFRVLDEVNSRDTESYHSWSSDGKWFVFSSRRIDGNWTRPYLAAFDTRTGRCSKPFLLPQKHPDFYLRRMESFNIPELADKEVSMKL